jgi:hypothetical protein
MGAYHNGEAAGAAVFEVARTQFEAIEEFLRSDQAWALPHGELEERLQTDGRELLRLLFQGHLELRALREKRQGAVVGSDGCTRAHVEGSERDLMTIFGPVRVTRLAYRGHGLSALHPLDARLNLPEEKQSHGLRRLAATDASQLSYDNALASVRRLAGDEALAKRQEEALVMRAAQDFDAFYAHGVPPEPASRKDLLVLSLDGKGIVMRREGLREATRQAAEQAQSKLQSRLSRGEKPNRKRMATVAAVYDVAPFVRTPEDILRDLRPARAASRARPRARNKRVWASVEKSAEEVTRELFDEAERRDPEHRRRWVVLVDGERHQIERLRAEAKRRGVAPVFVLDLIHLLEYLWKAAWCFFAEGDAAAEAWVTEHALAILKGSSSAVAAGIRRSATLRGLRTKDRKGADDCADYLLAKRDMLHYEEYLQAGLPIATGVIEGACRHLINDRLDITGARWSVRGAEAVLRLRAVRSSSDFDAYWRFHLGREYLRHHASRYASKAALEAA